MKVFCARFSKAIGALGGTGVGQLISWVFIVAGHPLPVAIEGGLPIVGGVIATVLAPPNSLTSPTVPPAQQGP